MIIDKQMPLFKKDPNEKTIEKLRDEVEKLQHQLTFTVNALHYACQILDENNLNTPIYMRNMEALIQGQEIEENDGRRES